LINASTMSRLEAVMRRRESVSIIAKMCGLRGDGLGGGGADAVQLSVARAEGLWR
jgi:hypothetical protein